MQATTHAPSEMATGATIDSPIPNVPTGTRYGRCRGRCHEASERRSRSAAGNSSTALAALKKLATARMVGKSSVIRHATSSSCSAIEWSGVPVHRWRRMKRRGAMPTSAIPSS